MTTAAMDYDDVSLYCRATSDVKTRFRTLMSYIEGGEGCNRTVVTCRRDRGQIMLLLHCNIYL